MRSLLLVLSCLSAVPACNTTEAGTVDVWTCMGAVCDVTSPGLYGWNPFSHSVYTMDTRVQRVEVSTSASSSDMQEVTATIVLNFTIQADHAREIFEATGTVSDTVHRLIEPALQEAVKTATARYTAEQLISERPAVKDLMVSHLTTALEPHFINVTELSITNFAFGEAFQRAIEAKQVAEQDALRAERDLVRIRTEAEQVAAAAAGEAQAQVARAQAESEAQRLLSTEITDKTLRLRAIEKWNGVLPVTMAGDSDLTFLLGNTQ